MQPPDLKTECRTERFACVEVRTARVIEAAANFGEAEDDEEDAGSPNTPLPMTQLMTTAVSAPRPMARTRGMGDDTDDKMENGPLSARAAA